MQVCTCSHTRTRRPLPRAAVETAAKARLSDLDIQAAAHLRALIEDLSGRAYPLSAIDRHEAQANYHLKRHRDGFPGELPKRRAQAALAAAFLEVAAENGEL